MSNTETSARKYIFRQRNYLIMQYLWFEFRHRQSIEGLYELLGVHRNKFRALVNNDEERNLKMESKARDLAGKSAADKEIFTGEKPVEIPEISGEEWNQYFETLKTYRETQEDMKDEIYDGNKEHIEPQKEQIRKFQDKLKRQVKNVPSFSDIDINLYKLYYWIATEGHPCFNGERIEVILTHIVRDMERVGFGDLERAVESPAFQKYYSSLKTQLKKVTAILNYIDAKKF